MPRPRLRRRINFNPKITIFKPQGVPLCSLEWIELTLEEMEALRLYEVEELNQTECARQMKTSQSTIQRILDNAHRKIAHALINGQAIKINGDKEIGR